MEFVNKIEWGEDGYEQNPTGTHRLYWLLHSSVSSLDDLFGYICAGTDFSRFFSFGHRFQRVPRSTLQLRLREGTYENWRYGRCLKWLDTTRSIWTGWNLWWMESGTRWEFFFGIFFFPPFFHFSTTYTHLFNRCHCIMNMYRVRVSVWLLAIVSSGIPSERCFSTQAIMILSFRNRG